MLNSIKPMLAATVQSTEELSYPLLASPKLDGIRALIFEGNLVSRNLKLIPNAYVQKLFRNLPEGLDGELVVGKPTSKTCFTDTTSGVMSEEGEPNVTFYIFDLVTGHPFHERYKILKEFMKSKPKNVKLVKQTRVEDKLMLSAYESDVLEEGYEGVMLRSIDGQYKFGRSTNKEGFLLKLKKFEDSEAEIIGAEELFHNNNERKKDELGRSKRSTHKENMIPGNVLGAFNVRDIHSGVTFDIGSGFTEEQREEFWKIRKNLVGKIIRYKFFATGVKVKPRFPVFTGFRSIIDI